jgi:hypothetical protein
VTFADYWVVGLRASAGHFFAYVLVAVITFMIGASIGLLVGAALADVGRGMEVRLIHALNIPETLSLVGSHADHSANVGRRLVCHHQVDASVAELAAVHLIRALGLVRTLVSSFYFNSP